MSKIIPQVFADPEELGVAAAGLLADRIEAARRVGRPFLLGCPSGRSPSSTYAALAGLVSQQQLDLRHVVIVLMDDYLITDDHGRLVHEDAEAAHSCRRFGREQIVGALNAAAGPERGISPDRLWVPDPADPGAYDDKIKNAGGVDIFLLASGASDGHVAFNPPGSPINAQTRVIELPEPTRIDNLGTFPSFGGDLEAVPKYGVSVGTGTIADLSGEVIMIVHGRGKGEALARLRSVTAYDPSWPATIVSECRQPSLFTDRAAVEAAELYESNVTTAGREG